MASAQELLSSIQSIYPYIDTGGNLMNELGRESAEGATGQQAINNAAGFSEVGTGANNAASALYKPSLDTSLNQIDLGNQGLDQNATDINRQYDTAGNTLKQNASDSTNGLKENFNNLGLLQSGLTGAGLGKIQSDLNTNLGNSEADRSSNLANIALQRAGLNVQKTAATNTYQQNVNDYVTKLLQGSQSQLASNAQLTPVDLGDRVAFVDKNGNIVNTVAKGVAPGTASASSGDSSIATLLNGILNPKGSTGSGDTPPPPNSPDYQQYTPAQYTQLLQNEFKTNGVEDYAGKDSAQIDAVVQHTGLSNADAQSLYYAARKPYESVLGTGPATIGEATNTYTPPAPTQSSPSWFQSLINNIPTL